MALHGSLSSAGWPNVSGSSVCRRRKLSVSSRVLKVQRWPLWMCSTSPRQSAAGSRYSRTRN